MNRIKNKYIYLKYYGFTRLYQIDYDSEYLLNLINEYSLKTGATIVEKQLLGSIMNSNDYGRVISCEVVNYSRDNGKVKGLSLAPINTYNYKFIINESEFIQTLLNCFSTYSTVRYGKPYTIVNFSDLYSMIRKNKLTDNDKEFLNQFLSNITILDNPQNTDIIDELAQWGTYDSDKHATYNSFFLYEYVDVDLEKTRKNDIQKKVLKMKYNKNDKQQ